jgi:cold shock protein
VLLGTVKWFSGAKGFGFITADNGEDIFVHANILKLTGIVSLSEGQKVIFDIYSDRKGPKATNVKLV